MSTQYRESNKVALAAAGIIAATLNFFLILHYLFENQLEIWHIIVLDLLVFGTGYLIYRKAVDRYIYRQMKQIFKFLPTFMPDKSKKAKALSYESLEGMNQAVMEWGARQRIEIEELKRMANYRREFLGNISHELKSPIFNIQGYILTLLDGGLEDTTINREYLIRTERSVNRLIAIVEDLEEISKLESGEVKLNLSRFDLADLAKDVAEFLELIARNNNVLVGIHNTAGKPLMVQADKKRIRQVLINLLENAIKYADKKENFVDVIFHENEKQYVVDVKDNGPGIAEESLPRIFERFYRTDKGRSRDTGGTGLGLAIVKHVIEAHQQKITVQSNLGEGSTFRFTLSKG